MGIAVEEGVNVRVGVRLGVGPMAGVLGVLQVVSTHTSATIKRSDFLFIFPLFHVFLQIIESPVSLKPII